MACPYGVQDDIFLRVRIFCHGVAARVYGKPPGLMGVGRSARAVFCL